MNVPLFVKVVGVISAIIVAVVVGIYFLIDSSCKNEITAEAQSPDKLLKAIVFRRDCGATTGYSTQISVLKTSKKLGNFIGNVFVADTNHGDAPSTPGGGPKVDVEWKTKNLLIISHHPTARIFKAEKKIFYVTIEYQATEH